MKFQMLALLVFLLLLQSCSQKRLDGFDESARKYHYKNNVWMARFAKISYQSPAKFQESLQDFGLGEDTKFELIKNEGGGSQVYLVSNADLVIIAFRGTEMKSLQDISTDIKITKHPTAQGMVHTGFYNRITPILPQLNKRLNEIRFSQQQPIFVTGHSLGGALSVLFGVQASREVSANIQGIYTYGQPKVGDLKFMNWMDKYFAGKYFRMVHSKDAIPRLLEKPYQHGGIEIYYEGYTPYCRSTKQVVAEQWWKKGWDLVVNSGNHKISSYIQRLMKAEKILTKSEAEQVAKGCKYIINEKLQA